MKKLIPAIAIGALALSVQAANVIVELDDNRVAGGRPGFVDELLSEKGIQAKVGNIYSSLFKGFSADLTEQEIQTLVADGRVSGVFPDTPVYLLEGEYSIFDKPAWAQGNQQPEILIEEQTTPWGIDRVGGAEIYTGENFAWVVDTGIDPDHPDLNVNLDLGFNSFATSYNKRLEDFHGHGSHVAGTIAAIDNEIGVVGVAAGATVVPIKVFDDSLSSSASAVLLGLDHVLANAFPGDVVNLSLGGPANDLLDAGVRALGDAGLLVVMAAGNEAQDANNVSPGRANGDNLYTVSAIRPDDRFTGFSNYGNPPIDYAAPGLAIWSTWWDGGYQRLPGTSMAAPHVAGILLSEGGEIGFDGYAIGDPDGNPDPIAHRPDPFVCVASDGGWSDMTQGTFSEGFTFCWLVDNGWIPATDPYSYGYREQIDFSLVGQFTNPIYGSADDCDPATGTDVVIGYVTHEATGTDWTFTVVPAEGYLLADVQIDVRSPGGFYPTDPGSAFPGQRTGEPQFYLSQSGDLGGATDYATVVPIAPNNTGNPDASFNNVMVHASVCAIP